MNQANHHLTNSRIAISFAFLLNGTVLGTWAGHIPSIKATFTLDEAGLGIVLLIVGLGAVITMPIMAWLIHRVGSRTVTILTAWALVLLLVPIYWINEYWQFLPVAFLYGGAIGSMDMAMNHQAVVIQQRYQGSVMSSFHGIFSLGGLLGSVLAALFLWLGGTALQHALLILFVFLLIAKYSFPHLIHTDSHPQTQKMQLSANPILLVLGFVALIVFITEGVIADWGALYLKEIAGSSDAEAALGFAAFSVTMIIGRLSGDYFINHLGRFGVLAIGGLLLCVGIGVLLLWPAFLTGLLGFALAGIGLANIIPIVFSRAGSLPTIASNIGIATVTFLGYGGLLLGPPVFGYLAHHFGLAEAFWLLIVFGIIVMLVAKICANVGESETS